MTWKETEEEDNGADGAGKQSIRRSLEEVNVNKLGYRHIDKERRIVRDRMGAEVREDLSKIQCVREAKEKRR